MSLSALEAQVSFHTTNGYLVPIRKIRADQELCLHAAIKRCADRGIGFYSTVATGNTFRNYERIFLETFGCKELRVMSYPRLLEEQYEAVRLCMATIVNIQKEIVVLGLTGVEAKQKFDSILAHCITLDKDCRTHCEKMTDFVWLKYQKSKRTCQVACCCLGSLFMVGTYIAYVVVACKQDYDAMKGNN